MQLSLNLIMRLLHQNFVTALAFGVEVTMTYTAMPMLIDKLSPTSYTTIVFVLGG